MSQILTPNETLKAIIDGRNLEFRHLSFREWTRLNPLDNPLGLESIFKGDVLFRLAQEMITIGGVSFPKPQSKPLEFDTEYWVADINNQYYAAHTPNRWVDDFIDKRHLRRGLIHLSREAAIAHAKALIKLSGGKVDE